MSLVGFIADAHGNKSAFDIGINILSDHGAETFFFLGDAVGYIPSLGVLSSINKLGSSIFCLRGNHEEMLFSDQLTKEQDEIYNLSIIRNKFSDDQHSIVSSWPNSKSENIDGIRVLMVHGSPSDPLNEYIYPDTDLSQFDHNADWVFTAHTHRPFIRNQNGVYYVNVGSCGLPRDDGRYGSVVLFDSIKKSVRILRYSIKSSLVGYFKRFPSIHPSVKALLDRRATPLIGDICE